MMISLLELLFSIVLWRTPPFLKWSLKFTKCFSSISFSKALFDHIKHNSVSHVILLDPILMLSIVLNLVTQEFPVFVDSYLLVQLTFMSKITTPYLSRNMITNRFRQSLLLLVVVNWWCKCYCHNIFLISSFFLQSVSRRKKIPVFLSRWNGKCYGHDYVIFSQFLQKNFPVNFTNLKDSSCEKSVKKVFVSWTRKPTAVVAEELKRLYCTFSSQRVKKILVIQTWIGIVRFLLTRHFMTIGRTTKCICWTLSFLER